MNRATRLALPFVVLACSVAGWGQQRKHVSPPPAKAQPEPAPSHLATEAVRDNNIGIALMNRQQFQDALGEFQMACVMNPSSDTGCVNVGVALLNMKQYEAARNFLAKSAERDPKNPHAWFNLGLLAREQGKTDDALANFEKVAALDPGDADTQYVIGLVYSEAGRDDQAIGAFEGAVKLDRFHASAELALSQAQERLGESDASATHLNRYHQLEAGNWSHQVSTTYGEQGKYSLAEEMASAPAPVGPPVPVHFVDVTAESGLPTKWTSDTTGRIRPPQARAGGDNEARSDTEIAPVSLAKFLGSGACVIDYDGDGKPDIFLVNGDGKGDAALYRNAGHGKFVDVTKEANIAFHGEGTGCAVGDYDNDGHPDIAISSNGGVVLYHNEGNGKFEDVTAAAGIHADGLSLGLTFIDYDHDGNLDLYVTRFNDFPVANPARPFAFSYRAAAPGNMLWRNKGDGTFEDRTKEMAVEGMFPSVGAIGCDFNADHAPDLVLTGWQGSPALFLNQRDAAFKQANPWTSRMPGPTAAATAFDFDNDGRMDLAFTHWTPPGLSLWRNVDGSSFERVSLPEEGWMRGWGLSALDYDDDGWTDIVALGENFANEGRIVLFRNEGNHGFRDVTAETGLDRVVLHDPRAVVAFDYDGEGATDLLITQNNLPPVLLRNVGGAKNGWLQLALQGTTGNKTGIGAEVEVFAGSQRQKWPVAGASGYLGQNSADVLAGLGDQGRADVLRVRWPDGSLQDELQVPGENRTVVTQTGQRLKPVNP